MSTSKPRAIQLRLLITVMPLPTQSLEHRTRDLLHTFNAVGITATDAQVHALAGHDMTGPGCWTPSRDLCGLDRATNQHFSIARHAKRVVEQSKIRAIRKETTR
jgi:hypothetical protein